MPKLQRFGGRFGLFVDGPNTVKIHPENSPTTCPSHLHGQHFGEVLNCVLNWKHFKLHCKLHCKWNVSQTQYSFVSWVKERGTKTPTALVEFYVVTDGTRWWSTSIANEITFPVRVRQFRDPLLFCHLLALMAFRPINHPMSDGASL